MSSRPTLVLASSSPRRADLLSELGLVFEVTHPDVDESRVGDEGPEDHVMRLAMLKAHTVTAPDSIVIAADTVVALGSEILGKPVDNADARRMLRALSGRTHVVVTAVAIARTPPAARTTTPQEAAAPTTTSAAVTSPTTTAAPTATTITSPTTTATATAASAGSDIRAVAETTEVTFVELSDHDIDWYVATGEPSDKAGAYGLQGIGGSFVESLVGNHQNVVGLPLSRLRALLAEMDLDLGDWSEP